MGSLIPFNFPIALLVLSILYVLYRKLTYSIVSDLRGPKPESFLLGSLVEYMQSQAGEIDFRWQEMYGDVVRFKGPFGEDRLLISDPKALQYILQTAGYRYHKPADRREISRLVAGRGLLWADADDHKRQRKIMNPAFASKECKDLVPTFSAYAAKLTSRWSDMILASPDKSCVVDTPRWASLATLDAMGEAGLDYQFESMEGGNNELGQAYANLFLGVFGKFTASDVLKQALAKFLPRFVLERLSDMSSNPRLQLLRHASAVAKKVSKSLVDAKTEVVMTGKQGSRDILSLLVRSNLSEEASTRMSEEEIMAQMRAVINAGYETTATTLSWILLEMARHPEMQTRLRDEIRDMERKFQTRGDSEFSANDFDSMPYLTAVIKESIRFHPVAFNIYRESDRADVLPLSKPLITSSGKVITELPIPKGQNIIASVNGYNRNTEVFGANTHTFNPDRWLTPVKGDNVASVGVWANLLTFSGGVRACIGWRFAVLELHAFLVELISNFEFDLTPEALKVRRETCLVVMAPTIEGLPEKGTHLPLRIKLVTR
ncbi:cytochrome P450 [Phlegmacium glaucopus]|nr:cytochrome P450 [Phlegmacium glaucopus]